MKSGVAYHLGPLGVHTPAHEKQSQSEEIAQHIAEFGEHNIIRLAPGERTQPVVDTRPIKVRRDEAKKKAFDRKTSQSRDAMDEAESIEDIEDVPA